MKNNPDDICARPQIRRQEGTRPHSPPIYLASVYECRDPEQALALLRGDEVGYVYQRDRHPNSDELAEKCRQLHHAEWALVTSSGMAALSLAALGCLQAGDHVVVSHQVYGHSLQLFDREMTRLGVRASVVDTACSDEVRRTMTPETRLVLVETISNPMLQVADIAGLAEIAHAAKARLLVDNTFASPVVCRPLDCGADWVMESISKMMNGHSDVMLGMLAGRDDSESHLRDQLSVWGLASSPFDCWLASRGLATLHLRMERACDSARRLADFLASHSAVAAVHYPTVTSESQRSLVQSQFLSEQAGCMLTLTLTGGLAAAERFMAAAREIPFCPSLGEVATTISHPSSTSHRGLSLDEQRQLGIDEGTLRLSVGTESLEFVQRAVRTGLGAV